MENNDFFRQYKQILVDGIDKVRKSGFKKLALFRQMIDTLEVFIGKEAYGRIVPGNYVLLFLLMIGSRNAKLVETSIRTMQKLISYNYIHENEELSTNLFKEDFREYLLVAPSVLKNRSVSEIYLQVLMQVQEKDEGILLLIVKNLSLVVRLFQHSLSPDIIRSVYSYLTEMLVSRPGSIQKTIKSTIIQVVRHILENLREIEFNILHDSGSWSVKRVCRDQLNGIVDQIVLRDAVDRKYGGSDGWRLIPSPEDFDNFDLKQVEALNEKNQPNGKFGWCTVCREAAPYYCKTLRIPVCSFGCKNKYLTESQSFDKLFADEARAQQAFLVHSRLILNCLAEELLHEQQKRRLLAIEIVNFVLAEPKRFKSIRNHVKSELSGLFRNCLINVVSESEAFTGCLLCIKKLLNLSCFVNEAELLLEMLPAKLTNIQCNAEYKIEILKFLRDVLNGELAVDLFVSLDCEITRKNSLENAMRSIATVFVGVAVPKDIVFEEDMRVKKLCFETLTEMIGSLGELGKKMDSFRSAGLIDQRKLVKKQVDQAIALFNAPDVKPEKAIKKLIHLRAIQDNPDDIARFMHRFMDSLSSVKIGEMVGGHTDLCKAVLESFNRIIEFPDMEVDSGLRHLLDHFTLPGESQQVDRIIDSFSHVFYRDNQKSVFAEAGAIYSLSFLLMMLQTNLHNPQVHEKMKLADVTKLARGMNKGTDFPQEYLMSLYNSVQRSQLGFHEKQKEIDFVAAYTAGGRKLEDLYKKDLERLVKRVYSQFKLFGEVKDFHPRVGCLPLLLDIACRPIVQVLNTALERTEEKESVVKLLEAMEALISLCIAHRVKTAQELLIELLSRRVIDELVSIKQLLITEAILDWTMKYSEWLDKSWKPIFSVISGFSRRKSIVKTKESRKPLHISSDKISLQEGWIDQLVGKSAELPEVCALALLNGLLEVSREEIRDNEVIFCLQKVGDFVECNLPRTSEIFNNLWPLLRDYYFELGCSPNEKVALFGVDFLKQTITKFMKKKESVPLQKDLFKPYEMIFANTELPAIKEFILGTIASLCTHNAAQLRYGWRVILSILAASFEDTQTPEIKAKSYQALSKLIEVNLPQLEEYYIDLTQILVKLTRQKEEAHVAGCIAFVRAIIDHYNRKYAVQPKVPNPAVDISFLQATWLPLLGVLSTICGDHRSAVQNEAMNYLFELLLEYGCLFKYEFWKMVFQGVIRPTFDEILYTYQIRGNENRKESQGWLERSCTKLFDSISELISVYYDDFRQFLPDIFRIYENCTQHANQLLTRLSINAVSLLLQKVAHKFSEEDWECFLQFFERLFRKTTPTELTSLEAWHASKSAEDYNQGDGYTTKCLSQLMLLGVVEQILDKFSIHLSEKVRYSLTQHLDFLYGIIKDSHAFSSNFNKQLELRTSLWKEGFIPEMKELPGLLRQERQSLKCLILVEYYRYQLAQNGQEEKFQQYIHTVLEVLNLYVRKHQELLQENDNELQRHETEREALNMRFLVRDTVIGQLEENGLNSIVAYRKEFFEAFLSMLRYSSTPKRPCSNCKRCESCQKSKDIEVEFDDTLNKLIVGLFNLKS